MKLLLFISFLLFSFTSLGSIQVKNIHLKTVGTNATLKIYFKGNLQEDPQLLVRDNLLQVALANGIVWPKIEKKVNIYKQNVRKDTTLLAYQFNKKMARVRAVLPFSIKNISMVDMRIKGNVILISFPVMQAKRATIISTTKNNPAQYDEAFLDKLLQEKSISTTKQNKKELKPVIEKKKANVPFKVVEDKVGTSLSGIEKSLTDLNPSSNKFDIVSYFGKFIIFLGVILLLFYFIVYLMRKGVLKKGKLGFLNNTNVITVLNTTYIGPKKSLLLVKVHNQTFLLSSTERGMEFLSEVNDTTGILKQGERDISGGNFDNTLGIEEPLTQKVTLKKDITKSAPLHEEKGILAALKKNSVKEHVRFSDQIKSKVKNLKPLQ